MDPLNKRRLGPTVILCDKYRLPLPPARVFVTAAPQPTARTSDGLEREENGRLLQVSWATQAVRAELARHTDLLTRLSETISVRTSVTATNSKNSAPLRIKATNYTAYSNRGAAKCGGCPAAHPNPQKPKLKTQRFCSYDIKRFTWFTFQAKSAIEIGGWLLH